MHRFFAIGVVAAASAAVFCGSAGAWSWPAGGEVLRPFTLGADAYAAGQHRGIDVAGPDGSPVRAPASGVVTFAGSLPTYGRGVTILTQDGYAVTLVHLGAIGVAAGAAVSEGDPVGTMGASGTPEQSVPSVHLGIRRAAEEEGYVDPLDLLPGRPAVPVSGSEPAPAPEPVMPAVPVAVPAPPPSSTPPPASAPPSAPPSAAPSAPVQPVAQAPASATGAPAAQDTPAPTASTAPGQSAETRVASPREPAVGVPAGTAAAGTGEAVLTDAPTARVAPASAEAPVFEVDAAATALPAEPAASNSLNRGVPHRPSASREARLTAAGGQDGAVQATEIRSQPSRRAHGSPSTGEAAQGHTADTVVRRVSGDRRVEVVRAVREKPSVSVRPLHATDAARPAFTRRPAAMPLAAERALGGGASAVHATAVPREPGRPAREVGTAAGRMSRGVVTLWRVALASALGLALAAMVARRVARRIGGNGALLPHHADLLRELDPAHRARVHDRGGGRLRTPPAAART